MKTLDGVVVSRKTSPAKRRAAGAWIVANIRRLQNSKTKRLATQALAEARGGRLAR
ncbi:MAG: hypothetical protein ACT4P4_08795 [Betaproteobacteria bacterium]